MMGDGFWMSPEGKLFRLEGDKHIRVILDNPEIFGTTKDALLDVYRQYGERIGLEGKAREQIIRDMVFNKGWVRIRHYTGSNDFWSIQVPKFNAVYRDMIYQFVTLAMEGNRKYFTRPMGRGNEIEIYADGMESAKRMSFGEIIDTFGRKSTANADKFKVVAEDVEFIDITQVLYEDFRKAFYEEREFHKSAIGTYLKESKMR